MNCQNILLVGTNLAFLLPGIISIYLRLWWQASIYMSLVPVSGLYHYIYIIDRCLFEKFICKETMYLLDHLYSYMAIIVTVSSVVHNSNSCRDRLVRTVLCNVSQLILLLLLLEETYTEYITTIMISLAILYGAIMVYCFRIRVKIDLVDFAIGSLIIVLSIWSYTIAPGEQYWLWHSIWHVLISIGMALMLHVGQTKSNFIKFITCNRICIKTPVAVIELSKV